MTEDLVAKLKSVLAELQQEYPADQLFEAKFSLAVGARSDVPPSPRKWVEQRWGVQVGNVSCYGETPAEARESLRTEREHMAKVQPVAERLAAVLADLPDRGLFRQSAIDAAFRLLLKAERR